MTQSEAFIAGVVVGTILGMSAAIAIVASVAAVVVLAITVVETVAISDVAIQSATLHVFRQAIDAGQQYWTAAVGFVVGMFVGTLARLLAMRY